MVAIKYLLGSTNQTFATAALGYIIASEMKADIIEAAKSIVSAGSTAQVQTKGQYGYKERSFSSLNYYPFDWKEYECVYRPVDTHWFLRLCNGH